MLDGNSPSAVASALGAHPEVAFLLVKWRFTHHLVMLDRERVGRQASPSAAVIDSQSVKTAEAGGPRGYNADKKTKGRKSHSIATTESWPFETPVFLVPAFLTTMTMWL